MQHRCRSHILLSDRQGTRVGVAAGAWGGASGRLSVKRGCLGGTGVGRRRRGWPVKYRVCPRLAWQCVLIAAALPQTLHKRALAFSHTHLVGRRETNRNAPRTANVPMTSWATLCALALASASQSLASLTGQRSSHMHAPTAAVCDRTQACVRTRQPRRPSAWQTHAFSRTRGNGGNPVSHRNLSCEAQGAAAARQAGSSPWRR